MSDDPKNPEDKDKKSPQFEMGDMFNQNVNNSDPNEIPDEIAFGSADAGVEEPKETEKSEASPEKPQEKVEAKQKDSNTVVSFSDHKRNGKAPEGKETEAAATAAEPDDDNDMATPRILGSHADLVAWDSQNNEVIPKDEESAAKLTELGIDSDIYVESLDEPGIAYPVLFDPLQRTMIPHMQKDPKGVDQLLEEEAERKKMSAEDHIEQAMNAEEEQKEKDKKEQEMAGRKKFFGEDALNSLGNGIGRLLAKIGELLKIAAQKILGAGTALKGMVVNAGSSRDGHQSPNEMRESLAPERASEADIATANAEQVAAVGPQGSSGTASKLDAHLSEKKQAIQQEAQSVSEAHASEQKANIKTWSAALGATEAGAPLIKSTKMYQEQLASRSSDDKKALAKATTAVKRSGKKLEKGVSTIVSNPDLAILPPGDQSEILTELEQAISKGTKTNHMNQLALNNSLDRHGVSTAAYLNQGVKQSQILIQEARENAKMQENLRRGAEQAATVAQEPGMAPS